MEYPEWIDRDWLLGQFAKRRSSAIEWYQAFVEQGQGVSRPLENVRYPLALDNDAFVTTAVELADQTIYVTFPEPSDDRWRNRCRVI